MDVVRTGPDGFVAAVCTVDVAALEHVMLYDGCVVVEDAAGAVSGAYEKQGQNLRRDKVMSEAQGEVGEVGVGVELVREVRVVRGNLAV